MIGIIMPVVSAMAYPTYMHSMQTPWVEWSRLLEAPFVLCEIFVILWASRKGMDSHQLWLSLPFDIKMASAVFVFGVFASSLLISAHPLQSVTMSIITILHLLFALSIYHLLRRSNIQDLTIFLMLLGNGLLVLAALTFWRFAFPPPASMVPGGVIEWGSALPGFISIRHFGSWTGAVATGFLVMLLFDEDKGRLPWVQAFYFLSASMTVWSGTRAAVLAMFIVTALSILVRRKMPSIPAITVTGLLTGTATTVALLLPPYNHPDFQLFLWSDVASANQFTSDRLELWAATFQKWQESVALGWGSGSIFWEVFVGWRHTQPHNAVLQFLISWGAVGTMAALWLLGRAITAVRIATKRSASLLPLLAILYTLLLMSLLEGMLHYPRFIMLVMIMFAAILAHGNRQETSAS
ncbi:O-antigen ligase family protein [Sphingorhabdus sp.]|uniref:O-antigen ligase family protein n=1 Tax=Sphingorhabdus sp. TaxID=1902408 RepID=UPI00391D1DA7